MICVLYTYVAVSYIKWLHYILLYIQRPINSMQPLKALLPSIDLPCAPLSARWVRAAVSPELRTATSTGSTPNQKLSFVDSVDLLLESSSADRKSRKSARHCMRDCRRPSRR